MLKNIAFCKKIVTYLKIILNFFKKTLQKYFFRGIMLLHYVSNNNYSFIMHINFRKGIV